jgi:MFS family permease
MVTQSAIGLELVPKEFLGSWNALNAVARGLLGIIAPLLGGLIWESLGPSYLFYFFAFLYLARLVIIQTVPDTVDWT